jgi:hypothetical protein
MRKQRKDNTSAACDGSTASKPTQKAKANQDACAMGEGTSQVEHEKEYVANMKDLVA